MTTAGYVAEREEIATACRILAARGLSDGFLGHISRKVDTERLLVRCRGGEERGLAFTTADDIRLVNLDGASAGDGELDGYQVPHELPLHTEVFRTRADVSAVVHVHPTAVVASDLADIRIRPIIGAYDIPGAQLAAGGVPVYPRGVLVRNRALAQEMVAALGDRPAVVLRGHGLTSVADNVQRAVLQAVSIDAIARLSLAVTASGGSLADLPAADLAELPDLGAGLNTQVAWRHEIARLGEQR